MTDRPKYYRLPDDSIVLANEHMHQHAHQNGLVAVDDPYAEKPKPAPRGRKPAAKKE